MGDPAPAETPFPLTETDKAVLALTDEEFKPHDWEDLKSTIGWRSSSASRPTCAGI
ncbi:conserved hypothetical protein [Verticillium alfalfae VaMs.102]|uniref:Uncharacterized protein n=1 Tax=Verticillium alfalfae (strain VaMs.102 / ATCC MYA-4576 / FGSC 10136) TaxID=526221 RepID=C9SPH9_VERA1|nr:conserved hypothetical protein [Verticillium alfalfae VaMs.102]EEY20694.1 conserved hypothetical protein [Verticillium alfalfae VaMs.102]